MTVVIRTGGMQDRRMQDRRDAGHETEERCRTGGVYNRRGEGQEGCRTGWMRDRRDAGQDR